MLDLHDNNMNKQQLGLFASPVSVTAKHDVLLSLISLSMFSYTRLLLDSYRIKPMSEHKSQAIYRPRLGKTRQ